MVEVKPQKYKFTLRQGFHVLLTGELSQAPLESRIVMPRAEGEELDKAVFEMEQAINAHTGLRAHIERVE